MLFHSRLAILVTTRRTKRYRWLAAPGVWCDLEGCRPAEHRLTALNWCSLLADTSMLIIFQARNPRRHPGPEDHRWGHHHKTGLVKVILSPPIRKPSSLSNLRHDNKGLKNIICRYPGSWCLHYFSVRVHQASCAAGANSPVGRSSGRSLWEEAV